MVGRSVIWPFGEVKLTYETLVPFVTVLVFASFVASVAEMKVAHGVMRERGRFRQLDFEIAVSLSPFQRPILVALESPALDQVRHHDDDVSVVLPNHLPEVFEG